MSDEICTGEIDYRGNPYNVDDAGYFCTVCGVTGDEDSRIAWKSGESVPHRKGVGGYERDVIDAAIKLAQTSTLVDDREEYEENEEALLEATRKLIAARAASEE